MSQYPQAEQYSRKATVKLEDFLFNSLSRLFFIGSTMLSEQAIEDFKKAFKLDYGIELDDATARYKAMQLLNMYRPVYKQIPKNSMYISKEEKTNAKPKA